MKKNNKLKELNQIDAKFIEGKTKTLDYLIGAGSSGPYVTANLDEYQSYINDLNSTDLQRHAEKVGLLPSCERRVLKDRLVREFKRFMSLRSSVSEDQIKNHTLVDSGAGNLSKVSQNILRDGA
jgi:hypothetical protein